MMEWLGRLFLGTIVYMVFGPVFFAILVMFWIITSDEDD